MTANQQCEGQARENTDRHLWPQVTEFGQPYEAIFVTKDGGIGINVQGNVIVKPLREWHRLAGGTPGRSIGEEQRPSNQKISEERLRNTRAWAAARLGQMSGAEVIVGAIDELLQMREDWTTICEAADAMPADEPPAAHAEYTMDIGEAGEAYLKARGFDPKFLPGNFFWTELWDAMRRASTPPCLHRPAKR